MSVKQDKHIFQCKRTQYILEDFKVWEEHYLEKLKDNNIESDCILNIEPSTFEHSLDMVFPITNEKNKTKNIYSRYILCHGIVFIWDTNLNCSHFEKLYDVAQLLQNKYIEYLKNTDEYKYTLYDDNDEYDTDEETLDYLENIGKTLDKYRND